MRSLLVVVLACALGCGARTELGVDEGCLADGGVRACVSGCGAGTQACSGGFWGPCVPASTERACTNACGEGVQVCDGDRWLECAVPVAMRGCEAACGAGVQTCTDGAWSECEGPRTGERTCTNVCGDGAQTCADGVWSACEVPVAERACSTPCGDGVQRCESGAWGPCTARMPRPPTLHVIVRDLRDSHPDFESAIGDDRGIVSSRLASDGKPVYRGPTPTTHGRDAFFAWYHDVPGVNASVEIDLPLRPSPSDPSLFVFEDLDFFPIDDRLFGNEGRPHNFHFTLEATGTFLYQGGETFRFRGDDDVFVFIDRRLVIDLGGVHSAEEATVALDSLGLTIGERYELHLFFAERHTSESTFAIETSVSDPILCE